MNFVFWFNMAKISPGTFYPSKRIVGVFSNPDR
jgi:hypothetical protein